MSTVSEVDVMVHFDARVEHSGCFRIHREVEGELLQPRLLTSQRLVRIDRILLPTEKLSEWPHGPIGVEIKRDAEKLDKAASQALDYSRSAFQIKRGWWIHLEWIFVYPFVTGTSVMAQHRIGTAEPKGLYGLVFRCNGINAIRINDAGEVLKVREMPMGQKAGNRG